MATNTSCPQCGKSLKVTEQYLGKTLQCAFCSHQFVLLSLGVETVDELTLPTPPAKDELTLPTQAAEAELPEAVLMPPDEDFVYGLKDELQPRKRPPRVGTDGPDRKRRVGLRTCPECGAEIDEVLGCCAKCGWVEGVGRLRGAISGGRGDHDSSWNFMRVLVFSGYFVLAFGIELGIFVLLAPQAITKQQPNQAGGKRPQPVSQDSGEDPAFVGLYVVNIVVGMLTYLVGLACRFQERISPGPALLILLFACCCNSLFAPWAVAWFCTAITIGWLDI